MKLGWLGGGIDRGHVGGCCKPNWGDLVRGITFCVRFPNQHPLVCCVCPVFACVWGPKSRHTHAHTAQILCFRFKICRGGGIRLKRNCLVVVFRVGVAIQGERLCTPSVGLVPHLAVG